MQKAESTKSLTDKRVNFRSTSGQTSIKTETVSNFNVSGPSASNTKELNITPLRMYSGYPDAIQRWFRQHKDSPAMYELFAQVLKIEDKNGEMAGISEHVVLVRGWRGPVVKVVYFTTDNVDAKNLTVGSWLRCVGTKLNEGVLRAYSVRFATTEELSVVQRLTYLSEQPDKLEISKDHQH